MLCKSNNTQSKLIANFLPMTNCYFRLYSGDIAYIFSRNAEKNFFVVFWHLDVPLTLNDMLQIWSSMITSFFSCTREALIRNTSAYGNRKDHIALRLEMYQTSRTKIPIIVRVCILQTKKFLNKILFFVNTMSMLLQSASSFCPKAEFQNAFLAIICLTFSQLHCKDERPLKRPYNFFGTIFVGFFYFYILYIYTFIHMQIPHVRHQLSLKRTINFRSGHISKTNTIIRLMIMTFFHRLLHRRSCISTGKILVLLKAIFAVQ